MTREYDENAVLYSHVLVEIGRERVRTHQLHDDHGQSMERADWNDERWIGVLIEEALEVVQARISNYANCDKVELRKELIQVAAMATAWAQAIDDSEES